MASIILFCEGENGNTKSYDWQILKLLAGTKNAELQTFGGKMGYKQYKTAYLDIKKEQAEKDVVENTIYDKAYIFRDRDFDFDYEHLEKTPHLIEVGKNEFASFRTCIENYMLDRDFFFEFLEKEYSTRNFLKTKPELEQLYIESAKEIRYYSTMRHALGFIRKGFPHLDSKPKDDENKAISFNNNFQKTTCQKEMNEYFNRFLAKIPTFSEVELNKMFEFFCQKFDEESFYAEHKFMIWFNGKELKDQIQNRLQKFKPQISVENYFDWLMKNHTREMWLKFDDLRELRDKIRV